MKMKRRLFVVLVGLVVCVGVRLSAHHSHSATYDKSQRVTIEGDVVQVAIRNPHSWVHVNVKQPNGEIELYSIEWVAGANLNRVGLTGRTLKAGDHVTITGHPGRNPKDRRMEMLIIRRPSDGWTWGTLPGEVVN